MNTCSHCSEPLSERSYCEPCFDGAEAQAQLRDAEDRIETLTAANRELCESNARWEAHAKLIDKQRSQSEKRLRDGAPSQ